MPMQITGHTKGIQYAVWIEWQQKDATIDKKYLRIVARIEFLYYFWVTIRWKGEL